MPSWLLIVILASAISLFWLCIIAGIIITCEKRISRYKAISDEAMKKTKVADEIINAYGTRVIKIGGNKE